MRKTVAIQIMGFALASVCFDVVAENSPKSGSVSIQSIFKAGAPTKFNDDYSHNTVTGVTFNERGSGILHLGKAACSVSVFTHSDINRSIGFCAYEDKSGDSIFIQYEGASKAKGEFSGINEIMGGTGKFENIRGNGTVECANTDKKSEFPCTSKFDYQLPE